MKNPKYKGIPQIEEGYTKIADEFINAICKSKLLNELSRVFFAILRLTWGYKKKEAFISNSTIVKLTGLNKAQVSRAKSRLIKAKVIKSDNKYSQTGINKRYKEWELSNPTTKKVIKSDNKKLSNPTTTVIESDNSTIYKEILYGDYKERGAKKPPPRSLPEIKKCFESYGTKGEESTTQATLFFNHHEAINWMKGKTPIVDWRPLVYNWILRDRKNKITAKNSPNIGAPTSTPARVDHEPEKSTMEIETIQAEIDRIEGLEYFQHLTKKAENAKTIEELEEIFDPPTVLKLIGYRDRLEYLNQELKELKEKNNE